MGNLTRDVIKKSVLAAGYQWYDDKPMIVGIRTTIDVPDNFNDFLTLSMPDGSFVGIIATTDPGSYWLANPERVTGTAIVKEGQYPDSHVLGYHGSGTRRHRAWQQKGIIKVYRDRNKDQVLDRNPATIENTNYSNGINIHSTGMPNWISQKIYNWSAGCQVSPNYDVFKARLTNVCDKWEKDNGKVGMPYMYTLLLEKQLLF